MKNCVFSRSTPWVLAALLGLCAPAFAANNPFSKVRDAADGTQILDITIGTDYNFDGNQANQGDITLRNTGGTSCSGSDNSACTFNKAYIEKLAKLVADHVYVATDGRHRIGTVTVFKNNRYGKDVDIRLIYNVTRDDQTPSLRSPPGWKVPEATVDIFLRDATKGKSYNTDDSQSVFPPKSADVAGAQAGRGFIKYAYGLQNEGCNPTSQLDDSFKSIGPWEEYKNDTPDGMATCSASNKYQTVLSDETKFFTLSTPADCVGGKCNSAQGRYYGASAWAVLNRRPGLDPTNAPDGRTGFTALMNYPIRAASDLRVKNPSVPYVVDGGTKETSGATPGLDAFKIVFEGTPEAVAQGSDPKPEQPKPAPSGATEALDLIAIDGALDGKRLEAAHALAIKIITDRFNDESIAGAKKIAGVFLLGTPNGADRVSTRDMSIQKDSNGNVQNPPGGNFDLKATTDAIKLLSGNTASPAGYGEFLNKIQNEGRAFVPNCAKIPDGQRSEAPFICGDAATQTRYLDAGAAMKVTLILASDQGLTQAFLDFVTANSISLVATVIPMPAATPSSKPSFGAQKTAAGNVSLADAVQSSGGKMIVAKDEADLITKGAAAVQSVDGDEETFLDYMELETMAAGSDSTLATRIADVDGDNRTVDKNFNFGVSWSDDAAPAQLTLELKGPAPNGATCTVAAPLADKTSAQLGANCDGVRFEFDADAQEGRFYINEPEAPDTFTNGSYTAANGTDGGDPTGPPDGKPDVDDDGAPLPEQPSRKYQLNGGGTARSTTGEWTLKVTTAAAQSDSISVFASAQTELELTASIVKDDNGDSIVVASLTNNDLPVLSAKVIASIYDAETEALVTSVALTDSGVDGDFALEDGKYSRRLGSLLKAGEYFIEVEAEDQTSSTFSKSSSKTTKLDSFERKADTSVKVTGTTTTPATVNSSGALPALLLLPLALMALRRRRAARSH